MRVPSGGVSWANIAMSRLPVLAVFTIVFAGILAARRYSNEFETLATFEILFRRLWYDFAVRSRLRKVLHRSLALVCASFTHF